MLLLVGQVATLAWTFQDRKKLEEGKLDRRAKLFAGMVAQSAARSLLDNYDFTYLSILIDEILKDSDIVSVKFKDHQGQEFVFAPNDRKAASLKAVSVPISTRLDEVGEVKISYTLDTIRKQLALHVLYLFLMQGVVFLMLLLMIRYFFGRVLGNRIRQVGNVIEEVKGGNLMTRVNYGRVDEIGTIANGFDFLVDHLAGTVDKMRAISCNLSISVDQVNHTLQHMIEMTGNQQKTTKAIFRSVDEASCSQQLIVENTNNLHALSRTNNAALEGIRTTFDGVVAGVDALDTSVGAFYSSIAQLRSSSKDVASLAERAAVSVRDASGTMDSINSSVARINEVVKDSTSLSMHVTEIISGKGIAAVTDAVDAMQRIESFFNTLSATITQLDSRSKDIAKILTVIQGVTEQAHLLSLNAQIIAAQAGENGKSFEVVAGEMKMLSAKTSSSAKEIEGIINTIQREMKSAVGATAETSRNVQQGRAVVAVAGEILHEILDVSRQSTQMMTTIADSTVEQNSLIGAVFKDIRVLRDLNEKVKMATGEEEKSAAYLFDAIGSICNSMGETRKETKEQAQGLKIIVENMDVANRQTEEIASASFEQQKVNDAIISSMNDASHTGNDMIEAVQEVSASIGGVYRELERLRREMEFFRTEGNQGSARQKLMTPDGVMARRSTSRDS
ncbi:MAG TPA: HAMP domain-containing methyl-accepting chemotaxis protein [Geobacteraceae bacterium]|nr:HAMP domain-containing methyl-accepting chemotaxis protein [Geobacteraceae bacterium]